MKSQLMWHPVVFDVTNAVSGEDGTSEVSRSRKRGAQMLGLWGCVETTNLLIFCHLEGDKYIYIYTIYIYTIYIYTIYIYRHYIYIYTHTLCIYIYTEHITHMYVHIRT